MKFDRTLVKIRERSFPEVLDLSVVVCRRRFRTVATAALAGILPFILLNRLVGTIPNLEGVEIALIPFEAPWATAPLTVVLAGLMFGEKVTAGRVAGRIFSSLPALILYQLIIRSILLVTVILSPLIPANMGFMNEVLLLERDKWHGAFKRVGTLRENRGSDLFGQFIIVLLASLAFTACFYFGSGVIFDALFETEITWDEPSFTDVQGLRWEIPLWTSVAFGTVVRFFSYIDQRIRIEGWEVELRLKMAGHALEGSTA